MRGIGHLLHMRKRTGYPPYPHPKFVVKMVDACAILAGIAGPIFVFPQLYRIYAFHVAAGVSPTAWFGFAAMDIPLLAYGIVHRDPLIITTYTLWFFFNNAVAIGAVLYS